MTSRSTVVVPHAHPDDEASFTGATIRALADAGTRVVRSLGVTGYRDSGAHRGSLRADAVRSAS